MQWFSRISDDELLLMLLLLLAASTGIGREVTMYSDLAGILTFLATVTLD